MRINVYAEELTTDNELVTKTVTDDEFGTRTFYGVRIFLKSHPDLHHSGEDDDRTAITFWVKWTKNEGNQPALLHGILTNAAELLYDVGRDVHKD